MRRWMICVLALPVLAAPAPGEGASPAAKVHFISPKNGAKVGTTFKVVMGTENIAVRKAGEDIFDRESGHHHLLIDVPPIPKGAVIPFDEKHIHLGRGQTQADVTLKPGKHTLQIQFADGAHSSYGPQLADSIEIDVVADLPAGASAKKSR